MVWGCISYNGTGLFKICEGTMDSAKYKQVLESKLLPSIQKFSILNQIHLDDSAPLPPYKWNQDLAFTEWNPKDRLAWKFSRSQPHWESLEYYKYKIKRRPIISKCKLIEEIKNIWENEISLELCAKLVMSMLKRVAAVKKSKGKITKY